MLEIETERKLVLTVEVITGELGWCISGLDDLEIDQTGELGFTRWAGLAGFPRYFPQTEH